MYIYIYKHNNKFNTNIITMSILDVNPTLTNRIRAVDQQASVQRAPKS